MAEGGKKGAEAFCWSGSDPGPWRNRTDELTVDMLLLPDLHGGLGWTWCRSFRLTIVLPVQSVSDMVRFRQTLWSRVFLFFLLQQVKEWDLFCISWFYSQFGSIPLTSCPGLQRNPATFFCVVSPLRCDWLFCPHAFILFLLATGREEWRRGG